MEKIQKYFDIATDHIVFFAPRVVGAVFIFWIGFKIIKKILALLNKTLVKMQVSESIRPFLIAILNIVLKTAVIFTIVSILGADLSGLVAILAAVSFAVGLSLQGSLGNFASGILILFLKPYMANDWIQIDDKFGKVEEIGIFSTIVITPGNKTLIIPNSKITDDVVINYSRKGMIRLEIMVTMPYEEDFPRVQKIIADVIHPISEILESPKPVIGIENFDSHSIVVGVRPYVKPDDYWDVTYKLHQGIKKAFHHNNVKVAYSEGVELGAIGG